MTHPHKEGEGQGVGASGSAGPGHTPGLWEATERSGYHEIVAPSADCDWYGQRMRHAVAYIDTDIEEAEAEANARLIAAAPMLLEGAEDTVEALKLLRLGFAHDDKAVEVIDAHVSELEYAIARAKGSDQ